VDTGATLGLAIIPPFVAIFFEAVNPIRHRFVESSVGRDFGEFEPIFQGAATPGAPTPDFDLLIEKASGSTKATVEVSMLALTGVSIITSGFAVIHEFDEPYWPAIFYVIFFFGVGLFLWSLLAGYTLFQIDDEEGWGPSFRGWRRSFSRSHIIEFVIYLLNGLLIIFALLVLRIPDAWVVFFKEYRLLLWIGLGSLVVGALLIYFVTSPPTPIRRTAMLIAIVALSVIAIIELTTDSRLANLVPSINTSRLGSAPDSGRELVAHIQGVETQLRSAGATLSLIQKAIEVIETRVSNAEATQSVIKRTLDDIDRQLLDMRIAQPVTLSYLTGADCRRIQQALKELAGYMGPIDGKCDGATNAAATAWQVRERRTIAPARSADEIDKRLRAPPAQNVNTGQ
jgi:hypothetical protein